MAKTVRLRGRRKLEAQLRELGDQGHEAAVEAATAWAKAVRTRARRDVAVDTGYLQGHIEDRINPGSTDATAQVGVWDPDAYYSTFVEHGTSSHEAQPFLLPAFQRERGKVRKYLRKAIKRRLR